MNNEPVTIIMRSFNEAWALRETLPALREQEYKNWKLIVIDSGSSDGSQELIRTFEPEHFVEIPPGTYITGRVLNQGMKLAETDLCIFLNADATPQNRQWLSHLVSALSRPGIAAVFGRQIPRPDCDAVFAGDYERCFGENRESVQWDHFFSMVSSGLKRSVWKERGFREDLQYAEDDEYTRWCRRSGHDVTYVPESVVTHSHNYSATQIYGRAFGDAKAIAAADPDRRPPGWIRDVILGLANDVRKDLAFCHQSRRLREWPHAAKIRWNQRLGNRAGLLAGHAGTQS